MRLLSIDIKGYRPFKEFKAEFKSLEVIVGANGAGKSSLFEFLKFLRDGMYREIPTEIIEGSIGQQIFHLTGPEKFTWNLEIDTNRDVSLLYQGELVGPVGKTQITYEKVVSSKPFSKEYNNPYIFMDIQGNQGRVQNSETGKFENTIIEQEIQSKRNQLALSTINNPRLELLFLLREYIQTWRFYSSFNIANSKIRKSVVIDQEPILHEDAGNLSSVLFYLQTEHQEIFNELQLFLRLMIPGFKNLSVKARGGPGEVIAFWQEKGVDETISLADLSDGILRLICWVCLCLHPHPPRLICIDEPDQGVHPRTLSILAGLFEKASERTQILLATHSSYFLSQFDLSKIAVIRKEQGEAKFIKPSNFKVLTDILADFGTDEIEKLHRSDELEQLI
ncbi:MAG: AAA family ATPase [Planktothrix sp.]